MAAEMPDRLLSRVVVIRLSRRASDSRVASVSARREASSAMHNCQCGYACSSTDSTAATSIHGSVSHTGISSEIVGW